MKSVSKKSSVLLLSLFCVLEASLVQAQSTTNLPDQHYSLPRRPLNVSGVLGLSGGSIGPGTSSVLLVPRAEVEYDNGRHHVDGNLALNVANEFGVRGSGQYAYDLSHSTTTANRYQVVGRGLVAAGVSPEGSPLNAGLVSVSGGYNINASTTRRSTSLVEDRGNYLTQTSHFPVSGSVRPRAGVMAGSAGHPVVGLDLGVDAHGVLGSRLLGRDLLTVEGRVSADLILGLVGENGAGAAGILDVRLGACLRSLQESDSVSGYCAGIRGAGQSFGNTGSAEGGLFASLEWGRRTNPQAVASDANRAPAARPVQAEPTVAANPQPAPAAVAPVAPVVAPPAPVAQPVVAPAPVPDPAPAVSERAQDENEALDAEEAAEETDVPAAEDSAPAQ